MYDLYSINAHEKPALSVHVPSAPLVHLGEHLEDAPAKEQAGQGLGLDLTPYLLIPSTFTLAPPSPIQP